MGQVVTWAYYGIGDWIEIMRFQYVTFTCWHHLGTGTVLKSVAEENQTLSKVFTVVIDDH